MPATSRTAQRLLSFLFPLFCGLLQKCGVGAMARIHYGTWRSLDRWADRQGLSVPEAIKRYHEQTYVPVHRLRVRV